MSSAVLLNTRNNKRHGHNLYKMSTLKCTKAHTAAIQSSGHVMKGQTLIWLSCLQSSQLPIVCRYDANCCWLMALIPPDALQLLTLPVPDARRPAAVPQELPLCVLPAAAAAAAVCQSLLQVPALKEELLLLWAL